VPEPKIKLWFRQILLGINHSHKVKVIHNNLMAEKILFKDDRNEECKIISFNLGSK